MRIVRITVAVLALLSTPPMTWADSASRADSASWADSASTAPVRLVVTAINPTITVGESVGVTIQLRGVKDQPARASKDYPISVEVRDQGRAFWTRSVVVAKGSDSQGVKIPIDRVGVFMVKASNTELREGAIWVNVRRKGSTAMYDAGGSAQYRFLAVAWQPPQSGSAADEVIEITIRSSDAGSQLYADGLEAAIIQAFVTAGHPKSDIALKFLPSRGVLQPNPLVIHASDGQAEGRLTSKERGPATLAPVNIASAERVRMTDDDWKKPVQFWQPIKTARVRPEHTERSLTDAPEDVWVELLGLDDTPVTPDADINVTLTVNARGDISASSVTVTPQQPQQKVQFTPRKRGLATITATPFGATPSEPGKIEVVVPWAALLGLVLGGFAGGLAALYGKKFKNWRSLVLRGLLGTVAALAFYWVVLNGLLPIPPATVGNTLFAALFSVIIGLGGTKALNLAWDLIPKSSAKASSAS